MNQRESVLAAAKTISQDSKRYRYISNGPPSCGSPACMLGWVGHYLGVVETRESPTFIDMTSTALGHKGLEEALSALNKIDPQLYAEAQLNCADSAAKLLRLYADKYHPAEAKATTELDPAFIAFREQFAQAFA